MTCHRFGNVKSMAAIQNQSTRNNVRSDEQMGNTSAIILAKGKKNVFKCL